MRKITYVFLVAVLFATSFSLAQSNQVAELQGKTVIMPENIQNFAWSTFPQSASTESGYYGWVQFYETPNQSIQDYFRINKLELIEYINNKTYLFYFPKGTNPSVLKKKNVRSIVPVNWETKVQQELRNGDIPHYATNNNQILVTLEHHANVTSSSVINDLKAQQIILNKEYKGHNLLELSIPSNCLEALASEPYVKWVELISAPPVKEDTRGKSLHRSNSLDTQTVGGNNYTGDGIGVLVRDDGIVGPHIDFQGRIDNSNASNSGPSHGDGVAGIMAGAGNLDPTKRGMAAGSNVFVTNYGSNFLDGATTGLINSGQVQITNSSYGDGCNGGYTSNTNNVDTQAHNNLKVLHVFSAGNSGTSNCGYGAGSGWGNITGGHKQGKNVIATANTIYNGTLAGSSSKGPAYDGRIKPDITAHGNGHQSTNENNTYQGFSGTSGAAPGIAGVSAQLYEMYGALNGGALPQAALIKATLLNTASDYGNVGPDFNFGWGLVNGNRAGKLLEDNRFLSSTISQGGANTHSIAVPAGTTQVRFMLYWNDPAAASGAGSALINDLDLTVTNPGNTTLLPYILDPTPNAANLNTPATNGIDRLNNMEQVVINTPQAGNYDIDISGFNVPMGPQEYFVVYEIIQEELTITYPNGGEKVVPGETETIHWDAINTTASFDLEYSSDNGTTWNAISTVSAATTNTDWSVPSNITGDALVRITSGAFQDVSDNSFSIANQPTGFQISRVCPQEATFTWNAVANAEEYDIYLLGAETMEVVATSTTTSATVTILDGTQTMWAAIVSRNNTLGWESRRTIALPNTGLLNCSLTDDLAISILNTQEDFNVACNSTNDVTVSVRLENFGSNAKSNFTYSYQVDSGAIIQQTYAQSLASGQIVNVDFTTPLTLSTNGSFTLNALVNASGDQNNTNDADTFAYVANVNATGLDFEETFEVNGFLPAGWSLSNPDNGTTWEERTNITGIDGNPTTTVYLDGANYTDRSAIDTFTTQFFDLTNATNSFLRFDLAKAQWSSAYNDRMQVAISIDCGATFTTVYDKDALTLATVGYVGSTWTPSTGSDWRLEEIDLTAFEGEIIQVRFINLNDYSNSTFIDNVRVEGTVATNNAPTAISFTAQNGPYEGLTYTFATADFGYSDADNNPFNNITVEQTTAAGTLYVDANNNDAYDAGEEISNNDTVSVADLGAGNLQYIQDGVTATSFQFEVNDGIENSTGDYIASLNITPKPTVTLSQTPSQLLENDATSSVITATLSAVFPANVTVNLSFSGTATNGTDYSVTGNVIVIQQGVTTGTISVNNIDDTEVEANETVISSISSVVNGTENGTQEVTYTIIEDDVSGPIAVCQDITVQLDSSGAATITAAQIDNGSSAAAGIASITIDQSTFSCANVGANTVTLTVTDNNNMTDTCTATVTVEDSELPTASCQNITVNIGTNGLATIVPADVDNGSADNCGNVTLALDMVSFNCSNLGANTVTLTATDSNGNSATCTATVTVTDTNGACNTVPTAVCQAVTLEADTNCEADADAIDFDGGSTDPNGDPLTFTVSPQGPYAVGTTTVTLTVSDGTNSSECTTTVTVTESVAPTASCQDITIQLDENGMATITAMDIDNGSVDACGGVTLSIDVDAFTCDSIGANTVILTVTDESNNTSSCSATVTVEDVTGPVFDQSTLPQGTIVRTIEAGTGTYTMEDFTVNVTATDGCSIPLLPIAVTQNPVAGTVLGLGTYDVTITAMDDAGNATDHVFELQVDPSLGTTTVDLSTLVLFPNPATDAIVLSNPNNFELKYVSIYDLQGRLILKVNVPEITSEIRVDVTQLQAASYIFVIKGTTGVITKTMIKE